MPDVISPRELKSLLDADPCLPVLDVRTLEEFEEVHVASTVIVPLDALTPATLHAALPSAAERPFYILCRSGKRADQASVKLTAAGLRNGVVVKGGIVAWKEAGYPVIEGLVAATGPQHPAHNAAARGHNHSLSPVD